MPGDRHKLEKLTVAKLRELAKERLGRGTSKLRTKAQLIEALTGFEAQAAPAPRKQAPATPKQAKAPPKQAKVPSKQARAPSKQAKVQAMPTKRRVAPKRGPSTAGSRNAAAISAAAPDQPEEATAPEPLVALPLDGQTLLVRWKSLPVRAKGERWEIEVSSEGQPIRTVPVGPRARQVHVKALDSGPVYRAKLVARDPDGRSRVVAGLSRPVVFFPQPPPARSHERFVRYSWDDPVTSAQGEDQPTPEGRLPSADELAAQGATGPAKLAKLATSPTGSLAGAPLGWLLGSQRPTSFAN